MKRNQAGIGLIELLVAIGLLGGLVLLISTLNQSANKVATNLEVNTDMLETLQEVQNLLSKADNCKVTFQGKSASNSINVVQAIKQKHSSGYQDAYPTTTLVPQKIYGSKRLKITSYTLSDAAPDVSVANHGTTHLVVNFNRGQSGTQTERITKTIPLNVEVDGIGNITNCVTTIGSKTDIWKYASNNSDIYYSTGAVGIGTSAPTSNLTIAARTFPVNSGVSILGSETATAGWDRASITFTDQSSSQRWALSMYGSASSEGEGGFGIGGGPGATGYNHLLLTKRGDVGINTNLVAPTCGMANCFNGRYLHVHTNSGGAVDASQFVLTSNAGTNGSLVGGVAFAASAIGSSDRRVAVITGHVNNSPGSAVSGNMVFWTNNNGTVNFKGNLFSNGDFVVSGNTDTVKVNQTSDRSLKKNIRPLKESLQKVLRLEGVSYFLKEEQHSGKRLGFIAQDVERVFPELVKTNDSGLKSVSYLGLIAPIIESIKDLLFLDSRQVKEINELEQTNELLRQHICRRDSAAPFCERNHESQI